MPAPWYGMSGSAGRPPLQAAYKLCMHHFPRPSQDLACANPFFNFLASPIVPSSTVDLVPRETSTYYLTYDDYPFIVMKVGSWNKKICMDFADAKWFHW